MKTIHKICSNKTKRSFEMNFSDLSGKKVTGFMHRIMLHTLTADKKYAYAQVCLKLKAKEFFFLETKQMHKLI